MKLKLISFIALIAMIFTSCNKEVTEITSPVQKQSVLFAELSQPQDENETKTSLDGSLNVVWSDDDAIAVFADNATEFKKYTSDNTGTGTTLGKFTGDEVTAAYAYYPYKGVTYVDGSNNISVVIPRVQTYSANSFGQFDMPMLATVSGGGLSFKNLMAVLKLQLTGTGIVDRIIVMSETQKMSGIATVATDGSITFSDVDGDSYKWVELDCGADGVDLSTSPSFYISVPSGEYAFTVRVVSKSSTVAPDKTVTSAKTFTANKIKPMASYAVAFGSDFKYVDGAYVGDPVVVNIGGTDYSWAPVNCGYNGSYALGKYGKFFQNGRKYGQKMGVTITPTEEARTVEDGSDVFNEFKFYSAKYNSGNDWSSPRNIYTMTKNEYDPCPTGWRVPKETELKLLLGYVDSKVILYEGRTYTERNDQKQDGSDVLRGWCFNGGYTDSGVGVFLPSAGFRARQTGDATTYGLNGSAILTCTQTSRTGDYQIQGVGYDEGGNVLYRGELISVSGQSQAQAFTIRCIKDN